MRPVAVIAFITCLFLVLGVDNLWVQFPATIAMFFFLPMMNKTINH